MKKERDTAGVSEIIGTILMLGIAIGLFSAVSLIFLNYPFSTPSPIVNIVGNIEGTDIIWEHHGGPGLDLDNELLITIDGTTTKELVSDFLENDRNNNGRWDIGERVIYPAGDMTDLQVDVILVDKNSNSVAMMGNLQEGIPPPSLETAVNLISPYEQSSSPLSLSASGESRLYNVSLYYRWSNNNWSADWTKLTYDDFEDGFGNYTDGGNDCSLYTGGTYTYQGNNAADIQDNSGDASSFYHTSGIDVDTPGYNCITVDFWFYAVSMEAGRDFWVQYYDGTGWNTVADYNSGVEFVNDQFYHEIVWIYETDYTFPIDMQIKFQCDALNDNDDVYIDEIFVNATNSDSISWTLWGDSNNPDTSSPWGWSFDFPNGTGYYEFYSIGAYRETSESAPINADARCRYNT